LRQERELQGIGIHSLEQAISQRTDHRFEPRVAPEGIGNLRCEERAHAFWNGSTGRILMLEE
jgi:hypothetical protein